MAIQRSESTHLKLDSEILTICYFSGEHGLPGPTTWRLKRLLFGKSWCHRTLLLKIQLLLHIIKCWHSLGNRAGHLHSNLSTLSVTFETALAKGWQTAWSLVAPVQMLLCQWRLLATPCDIRRLSSRPNPSDSSETFVKRKFFKFHQYTFCVRQKWGITLLEKTFVRCWFVRQ